MYINRYSKKSLLILALSLPLAWGVQAQDGSKGDPTDPDKTEAISEEMQVEQDMFLPDEPQYIFDGIMEVNEKYQVPVADFFQVNGETMGMSPDDAFKTWRINQDELGFSHYKMDQYYKGVRLDMGGMILHELEGEVVRVSGRFFKGIDVDVNPAVNEEAALTAATTEIGAHVYAWEDADHVAALKSMGKGAEAAVPPGELLLIAMDEEPQVDRLLLAYRFRIEALDPYSLNEVYVDAQKGTVLEVLDGLRSTCVSVPVTTNHHGIQTITVDQQGATFFLEDHCTGGANILTYDAQNSTTSNAVDLTDADTNWDDNDNDAEANSAHWSAMQAMEYFDTRHSRTSWNGSGGDLEVYVHYGTSQNNAAWAVGIAYDAGFLTIWDADGTTRSEYTALETVGHEVTHGITASEARFKSKGEQYALDEGYSDIFGAMVELYGVPNDANWLHGDFNVLNGLGYLRNMEDPNLSDQPDTYKGTFWASSGTNSHKGHTNNGVLAFWFVLLSDGGSGTNDNGFNYNVLSIGSDAAARIAFRTLTVYHNRGDKYKNARKYSIQAAIDLYGNCSFEATMVARAWDAVGVGEFKSKTVTGSSNGISWIDQTQKAKNLLIGDDYEVKDDDKVTFIAGEHILLRDDFITGNNSEFYAYLDCALLKPLNKQAQPVAITYVPLPEADKEEEMLPGDAQQVRLDAFPNPFSDRITLAVRLPEEGYVSLEVTNIYGALVERQVLDQTTAAGTHQFTLQTYNWAKGVYLVTLRTGHKTITKKIVHQ